MEFSHMNRFIRPLIIVAIAASLGACASKPEAKPEATSQIDLKAPPKKPLDAKTQLETGRRY
jgi:type IV pilus biogenesis protein CpaD/CtpE